MKLPAVIALHVSFKDRLLRRVTRPVGLTIADRLLKLLLCLRPDIAAGS
jgi:hypothetical protein